MVSLVMTSNCLFYAIWRKIKYGDYILFRKSRHNHWWLCFRFHIVVMPKERAVACPYLSSFIPDDKDLGKLPCPLFKGHIKIGDENVREDSKVG